MIISRAEIESVVSVYRASAKRKSRPGSSASEADRYEPTEETTSLASALASIFGEPLYRAGLVADLSRRIAEGKYYVPADSIVEKLLGRLVAQAI